MPFTELERPNEQTIHTNALSFSQTISKESSKQAFQRSVRKRSRHGLIALRTLGILPRKAHKAFTPSVDQHTCDPDTPPTQHLVFPQPVYWINLC